MANSFQTGYCTNVHAGVTLAEVKTNLERFAAPVRNQIATSEMLGIGLWLSEAATRELSDSSSRQEFARWLRERGLYPYTFNGFPFGDFHQKVVKHEVYKPTWADRARLNYTIQLAEIQATLIDEGDHGTISTLPLGWPSRDDSLEACAANLVELASQLKRIHIETNRHIRVCIEPEPGCIIDNAPDLAHFFNCELKTAAQGEVGLIRDYLGVCHDVCHSAVMFEPQVSAVKTYQQAEIAIGKVQVSSAVEADFSSGDEVQNRERLNQLADFAEERYLHQTSIESVDQVVFFEDLPEALRRNNKPVGTWRIHFHVPICQSEFGLLGSTQKDIQMLVNALRQSNEQPHYEIETYAWNVLPPRLQEYSLSSNIVNELNWFASACS